MKQRSIASVLGIVLVAASAGPIWASNVRVTVKDPGGAVAKAFVEVGEKIGTTATSGIAVVSDVAAGTHTVSVSAVCVSTRGAVTEVRTKETTVKVGDKDAAVTIVLPACPPDPGKGPFDED